jgi:hypothetical protein
MSERIKIKKNEDQPETKEILAEAIVRISDGFERLKRSGLNEDAIVALIQAKTKLSLGDIRLVIDSLAQLKGWYCR